MNQRVAFVTSGAKGLGHTTVKALLQAGWDVFFTFRTSQHDAKELVAFAEELGRKAAFAHADLLVRRQTESAVQMCMQTFGRIDAFIHNFGPFVFERFPLSEYTDDMWVRMIDGNLTNFFWVYKMVIQGMREREFGRIITIGYDGAADAAGWRFRGAYAAAKAGLTSLTRTIAQEERHHGVTCNMVCPGDIRGSHKMQMIHDVRASLTSPNRPPVGEDVSRVIAFLCEENSTQLNGTVTEVTGGYDILAYDRRGDGGAMDGTCR